MNITLLWKPWALAVKRHVPAVSFLRVHTKLATGRVKQDEENARAANASINIVDGVHCSILEESTSSEISFSSISVRTVLINR